ncbi:eukaryotic translation initiation factor 2 subunit alpha, putative [Entamoeba invadens IP1]|uniref:Eukaryotic translation initiation factor 2 subunit alpha, putative n=2 Tax=Entamoeba invadens TaxID=33085 RepID=A0A0A1TWP4_ENTIV|nr:eukaryotic translation initiation factor 2 subunit alpha, putative [Entamoeba invadens IP1]ELP85659.1 eukaryotic translation initiation factor 2 subunit alpha, putative [Entamoeba invadens IP1]BAN40808.1 eukaryotic translation initiation factor 2 subunit alpha, putative [Entamoeba invadens]|eukprot:XP_004185005.1 eukaryotic translation initiation factor 2 subunit alpha, putative [Entamoeba invadens IP1]
MSVPDHENPMFHCRMHEKAFPSEDDLCLVTVVSSNGMGTYVALKEYDDIQGMIPMSEHSRRRFTQTRIARVGKEEVATVIRVNSEGGFIDLSLKRTTPEAKSAFLTKYAKDKEAHLVIRLVAQKMNVSMEDLYKQFGWPLAKEHGSLHDAFKKSLTDPDIFKPYNIDEKTLEALKGVIAHYFTIQPLKFRADIEVTCYAKAGVSAVKNALMKGLTVAPESGLVIKLVSSPLYGMHLSMTDRQKGIEVMYEVIARIKEEIEKDGGFCTVKRDPCVVCKEEELAEAEDEESTSQDVEEED